MTIDLLVQMTVVHNFLQIPRFQRYRPQFKWNGAVLRIKQWRRLLLTSLKLSFDIPFVEASEITIDLLSAKDCCSQFFTDSVKYVPNWYSPQFKWNQAVLLLKQWRRLLLTSLKLSFQYTICRSLRNDDWFTGAKDCCSQLFADSAKYVSNCYCPTVQMESSRTSTQKMTTIFSNIVETFLYNTIFRSVRNDD